MNASSGAPLDAGVVLADHVREFPTGGLPAGTARRAAFLVLDTVGAAVAAVEADGVVQIRNVVRRSGATPEAGVWVTGERTNAAQAALVNATMARALELDDVHELGLTHATATMVPVALAMAARRPQLTGAELLTAIALGIDAGCRLSMAPISSLGGEGYVPRSMSRTYQTGVLAGSLVAARIAGADRQVTLDALGNGYSQCDSYIHANRHGYSNVYTYSHINGDSYGNGDIYAYAYSYGNIHADADAELCLRHKSDSGQYRARHGGCR